jgi:hypothetical protein
VSRYQAITGKKEETAGASFGEHDFTKFYFFHKVHTAQSDINFLILAAGS